MADDAERKIKERSGLGAVRVEVVRLGIVAFLLLCGIVLEQFVGLLIDPPQIVSRQNRLRNFAYTMSYHAVDGFISPLFSAIVLAYVYRAAWIHVPVFRFSFWVSLLLTLLLGDFLYYWFHRLQHTKWIWPQHSIHHSDEAMNASTSWRVHWLESPARTLIALAPAILFSDPLETMPIAYLILRFHGHFTHMNTRLRLGFLTPVTVGPQMHRIHHSRLEEHRDRNFSGMFPLWDILFGTYHAPKCDEFPATGIAEGSTAFFEGMFHPFKEWLRMIQY